MRSDVEASTAAQAGLCCAVSPVRVRVFVRSLFAPPAASALSRLVPFCPDLTCPELS